MGDVISDIRVARIRRTALNHAQIRHLATSTASTTLDGDDLDLPPQAVDRLIDAVLLATGQWLELRGVLLAADRLDTLISDTQRHLIDPATRRAENNPDLDEILMLHQQYIDGMREARNEVGATASNVLEQATAAAAPATPPSGHDDHAGPASAQHVPQVR